MINTQGLSEVSKKNQVYTSLAVSIFRSQESMVQVLAERTNVNVNQVGSSGNSLLMFAAMFGQYESAVYFLNKGADYTIVNKLGQTALKLALIHGNWEIARLLESYGATA